jgi:hypothetical protein
LQTLLAGGDLATDLLETVVSGQKTLLPYVKKLRTMLGEVKDVVEATDAEW